MNEPDAPTDPNVADTPDVVAPPVSEGFSVHNASSANWLVRHGRMPHGHGRRHGQKIFRHQIKESHMGILKKKVMVAQKPSALTIDIALRRQSKGEERHFNEAVRILLSEWVRQHLDQWGGEHEASERS